MPSERCGQAIGLVELGLANTESKAKSCWEVAWVQAHSKEKWASTRKMILLLNQTWVYSPVHNKANLLTLGCREEKCSLLQDTKPEVQAADAQKTQTL